MTKIPFKIGDKIRYIKDDNVGKNRIGVIVMNYHLRYVIDFGPNFKGWPHIYISLELNKPINYKGYWQVSSNSIAHVFTKEEENDMAEPWEHII